VFDQEDLARRTEELAQFIEAAARTYELDRTGIVAWVLERREHRRKLVAATPGLLRGAVLLSP